MFEILVSVALVLLDHVRQIDSVLVFGNELVELGERRRVICYVQVLSTEVNGKEDAVQKLIVLER